LASPRLIQLFIVPSGTPDRSALVIGEAAHEGSLDRQGLALFDLIETGLEPLLLLGRGEELERRDSGVRHIGRRFDRLATACERT